MSENFILDKFRSILACIRVSPRHHPCTSYVYTHYNEKSVLGVSQHVGEALISERCPRLRPGRVVSIGISPWGLIEGKQQLVQTKDDVRYHSKSQSTNRSKKIVLNNRLSYFLLVDNGTVDKSGCEVAFRMRLEKGFTSSISEFAYHICS